MFEYYFAVDNDDDKGVPFGPVNKDNLDISRLIVDFTCWLDANETVTELSYLSILANPSLPLPPWQANYPLDETSKIVPPDPYPLIFTNQAVIHSGKAVVLDLAAGTPQLSYAVSFAATAGLSQRRRLVDVLMAIDKPLNSALVSSGPVPPVFYPLVIHESVILPFGFVGTIYAENTTSGPISITLPPAPVLGGTIAIKDVLGNAGEFWITIVGSGGGLVDRAPELVLRSPFAAATLQWSGSWWSQFA